MQECDILKQQAFANDYIRHSDWKLTQVRNDTEFSLNHLPASKDGQVDWEQIEDDDFFDKRINIKILKFRSQPRQPFNAADMMQSAMSDLSKSGTIEKFRLSGRNTYNLDSLNSDGKKRMPVVFESPADQQEADALLEEQRVEQSRLT